MPQNSSSSPNRRAYDRVELDGERVPQQRLPSAYAPATAPLCRASPPAVHEPRLMSATTLATEFRRS